MRFPDVDGDRKFIALDGMRSGHLEYVWALLWGGADK
jgi:hypothetical protein